MGNPKSKGRRRFWWATIILLLAASGGSAWYFFIRKKETVVTVQTEKVQRRNLTEIVVANGKIQPVVQVVINPEVSGEIVELPVKDGQDVKKGDLLVKLKPDNYRAARNSIEANYRAALAAGNLAQANLSKAEAEYKRSKELFGDKLVSDSQYLEAETTLAVAKATFESSSHQADQAKASLAKAEDDLLKTTILSPMDGTVTRLRSQLGERVVGTALMSGTEIMTIANLDDMEARVDIGEIDVILIEVGQKAKLQVDAFREREFAGIVTEIANAAKGSSAAAPGSSSSSSGSSQGQEATKFEVKIRVQEKEVFRPGMSVTAEIETRYRTNVLCVPIQSVTTRVPKDAKGKDKKDKKDEKDKEELASARPESGKKKNDAKKPAEVIFVLGSDYVHLKPVKRGISDDSYVEIIEGAEEGQEVISGGYKAINRELEDGRKIKKGEPKKEEKKDGSDEK
ncbi:MAG TPA: efflux RND transporter periplasmic adaptor subunit [Candidatus Binatia bacterium]|nr:efflux RND transporter periplasmic adaptor subunit [Candidatus Binatia bacterium]